MKKIQNVGTKSAFTPFIYALHSKFLGEIIQFIEIIQLYPSMHILLLVFMLIVF